MSLSTALVERAANVLEGRLSRRSLINRSAFVGSAVAVGSGLDLALRPGSAYGAICECGNAGCGCGSTCCSGFSEFCCAVSGANFCPENTIMGGWWVADNSSYCGGPRYYMDCNATCSCDNGCSGGFPFCEHRMRRDRLRLRPAGLRLLSDRLPPVPLRTMQPGGALPGSHCVPGGRLRPALDGRSDLHDSGRGRQRHSGAERAVLDNGSAGAPVHVARHGLQGGRPGAERRRRRLRRAHRFRAAVRVRGLPQRRRRVGSGPRRADRGRRHLQDRWLLPRRGRRRHLRLRRGAVPGLHGWAPARRAGGRHRRLADRPGLLDGGGRRRHLRLRRCARSSAPWGAGG